MLELQVVFICAAIGLVMRAISGLNLLALFGSVTLVSMILPAFLISLSGSPEASYDIANTLDQYAITLTTVLPSIIVGQLLGFFIKDIVLLPKTVIDHLKTLL